MNVRTAWICCLLAGTVIFHCEGIKWIGLYRYSRTKDAVNANHFTHNECNRARNHFGFKKRQFRYCKNSNYSFSMSSIHNAAKAVIFFCRKTFENRRWNCSSPNKLPKMSKDLQRGTQEQAVVYAFASAALVYSIGRSCSSKNAYCPCVSDPREAAFKVNETHKWGKCDDNFKKAELFVAKFLGLRRRKKPRSPTHRNQRFDSPYLYRNPRAIPQRIRRRGRRRKPNVIRQMNHHNYEAGIRLMDKWRRLVCKCHGLSGSCAIKHCYYRLTPFNHQGLLAEIRSKYMNAVMVKMVKNGKKLVSAYHPGKRILPTDLVCITRSPDYCTPDPEVGSLGTVGRKCVSNASDSSNCEEMCCGRGYVIRHTYIVNRTCNCRIVGQFNMKCTPCNVRKTHHICN